MTFLRARSRAAARRAFQALRLPVAALAVCALGAALSACSPEQFQYGTPVVTMHASPGPFTSYKIGIASMYLTRTDGITASLLDGAPEEQIDLAALHDHPELVSAPGIPTGTYVNLTVTIDTGGASGIPPYIALNVRSSDGTVVNNNAMVSETNLLNTAGAGISGSYQTFVLTFDPAHPFNVTQNQSFRLDFDMDLEASNIIDGSSCTAATASLSASTCSPLVYANPVLAFDYNPTDFGSLRARGLLVVVQPSASTPNFIMNMHPFNDELYALGAMTVNVTPQTYYNINNQVVTGNDGLTLLQQIPISGNVLVYGTLDDLTNIGITPSMTATTVIGGFSLENFLQGQIQGVVSSNTGSSITVLGASYIPNAFLLEESACYPQFFATMPITVDSSTQVFQDGVAGTAPALADIPVGQQVTILGQPIATGGAVITDCTPPVSFDTTLSTATAAYPTQPLNGVIRMMSNTAQGTVTSSASGTATVDLLQLGPYDPSTYTFSNASTASAFDIATGGLTLPSPAAGTFPPPVFTFTGNPAVKGAAPPDFTASAVSQNPTELIVEWFAPPATAGGTLPGGTLAPFKEVTTTAPTSAPSTLTLSGTDPRLSRAVLQTGPTSINLSTLPAFPVIMTKDNSTTFTVGDANDGLFQYQDILSFDKEVSTIMAASTTSAPLTFAKLVAQGTCSNASCTNFNATRVTLVPQ